MKMEELVNHLTTVVKSKDFSQLSSTLDQLRQVLSQIKGGTDKTRAFSVIDSAEQLLQQRQIEEIMKNDINNAIQARDLVTLESLIEKAKSCGVSVRDAKKAQRRIVAEDVLRNQLVISIQNNDKLCLQALLDQVTETFPYPRDVEVAQNCLERIMQEENDFLSNLYGIRDSPKTFKVK